MSNNKMTITVLKSPAYNRLHRKHKNIKFSDLRQSLGLAIPKENKAYIRLTPDYETNKAMIMHEMEELIANESAHEINGVRYGFSKWWKKTKRKVKEKYDEFRSKPFRTLERSLIPESGVGRTLINVGLGAIPGIGPALATGWGALGASRKVPEGTSFGRSFGTVGLGALTGYGLGGVGKGIYGGIKSWAQPGGTSFLKDFGSGFKSGVGSYLGTPIIPGISKTAPSTWFSGGASPAATTPSAGVPSTPGGIPMLEAGGPAGTSLIPGAEGIGPSLATGAGVEGTGLMTGTGVGAAGVGAAGAGMPAITATTATGQGLLQKIGSTLWGAGKGLLKNIGPLLGPMMMMGGSGAAGMAAEPPIPEYKPEEYVKRAKETMTKYNLNALPEYAQEEAREMIELPISGPELEAKVDDAFGRTEQNLELSREHQIQAINRQYAQAGATGDTQQAEDVARINQYINAEKVVARAEVRATLLSQAYGVKKSALQTVMTGGQWDGRLAMQLSNLFGNEDELINALEQEDYASFQQSMSNIFGMGASQLAEIIMRRMFPDQNVA